MRIPFTTNWVAVISFLLLYKIGAGDGADDDDHFNVNLYDLYSLNNSNVIIVELQSTWSSWFRNTYTSNKQAHVTKFREDNTLMVIFDVFDNVGHSTYLMVLFDGDGRLVAHIDLQKSPNYVVFVRNVGNLNLDEFERRYRANGYKSLNGSNGLNSNKDESSILFYLNILFQQLDPNTQNTPEASQHKYHAPKFDISFVEQRTKTLKEVEQLGNKVCTVRKPIVTLVLCDQLIGTKTADVDILHSTYSISSWIIPNHEDAIEFHIITSLTDDTIIKFDDIDGLINSNFDPTLETVVVIHGFRIYPFSGTAQSLINEYKEAFFAANTARRVNLIGINWTGNMPIGYLRSTYQVKQIGITVGNFLYAAIQQSLIRSEELHLIGHSLGAHVAGFIGKTLQSLSHFGLKPAIISALDPAGPWFNNIVCSERICATDADWVEIFFSNAGTLAMNEDLGHTSYYLNGGNGQPGCWFFDSTCHHAYVNKFYRNFVVHRQGFNAWLCANTSEISKGKYCRHLPCNPRKLHGDHLITREQTGLFLIPYPAITDSDITGSSFIPVKPLNIQDVINNTINNQRRRPYSPRLNENPRSITLLGVNPRNVAFLAGLLTDNSDLHVRHVEEDGYNMLFLPDIYYNWIAEYKYHIHYDSKGDSSTMAEPNLRKDPTRFVLVADYSDLFAQKLWKLLDFVANDADHTDLCVVVMHLPPVPFWDIVHHPIDEFKNYILNSNTVDKFEIVGLHDIDEHLQGVQSVKVTEIPNLQKEVTAIKLSIERGVALKSEQQPISEEYTEY